MGSFTISLSVAASTSIVAYSRSVQSASLAVAWPKLSGRIKIVLNHSQMVLPPVLRRQFWGGTRMQA